VQNFGANVGKGSCAVEPPDRPYSGKIALRVSPGTHRRAATRAHAAGMSLNQWIAHRIETGT